MAAAGVGNSLAKSAVVDEIKNAGARGAGLVNDGVVAWRQSRWHGSR
jgi:hypothetical protein